MGLSNARVQGSVSHNRSGVETGLSPHRPRTNASCGHCSLMGQERALPVFAALSSRLKPHFTS
jgi:hypothetical protein